MWGIAGGEGGWTGADDETAHHTLQLAVDLGCTFFDTAWIYGRGHSERLLGRLLRDNPSRQLIVATKIPPMDRRWPSTRESRLEDVFPPDHIRAYLEKSLDELGLSRIDLLQFHVWEDGWAHDLSWQRAVQRLREEGLIRAVGISVNRWEPWNVLETLRTGLVDAVQVIYNIFDQAAEDELFPECERLDIGVIARVPFDEGSLTGTLTRETTWPKGDWRNSYFVPDNLSNSVERAERIKALVPEAMSLSDVALRFILDCPHVDTVIPGMRTAAHVRANLNVSDATALDLELINRLRAERWDRVPTWWSQ